TVRNELGIYAVEVRLFTISLFMTTFERHRPAGPFCSAVRVHIPRGCYRSPTAFTATLGRHLRALLFQNCFARESDAIAFHRENLHEDLISFTKFVFDVLHAMLGDF